MSIATIQSAIAPFAQSITTKGSYAVSCLTDTLQAAKHGISCCAMKIAQFATSSFQVMGQTLSKTYAFATNSASKTASFGFNAAKGHPYVAVGVVGTLALTAILAAVYARSTTEQSEPSF